jgi:hypothetical protein
LIQVKIRKINRMKIFSPGRTRIIYAWGRPPIHRRRY